MYATKHNTSLLTNIKFKNLIHKYILQNLWARKHEVIFHLEQDERL